MQSESRDQPHPTEPFQANVESWDRHYRRDRARQSYPDENLVRLLRGIEPGAALDWGCGSGRHLQLLHELGFGPVCGLDSSAASIQICRERFPGAIVRQFRPPSESSPGDLRLPFDQSRFQVIVLWGVLHYNTAALQHTMLAAARNALQGGGTLLGTLRSDQDTHYQGNMDINTAPIQFFSERECRAVLGQHFERVELGFLERRPVGELERRVCHWIFRCH
ncbi:MAG: class I SAM-dependent methyltransferase [Leptospiraceae bacterium]|nr:class I SAM-dependent methyltransferase [Leptospiraceae bacterium]